MGTNHPESPRTREVTVPLKSFSVERFRAFRERTSIDIRPLTLLFGYNSSGKSALLRVIPLLRDTLGDGRAPLFLGSPSQRGASFSDLRCRLDPRPVLSIELESDAAWSRYDIRDLPDQRRQVLEKVSRIEDGAKQVLEWTTEENTFHLTQGDATTAAVPLDVEGLHVSGSDGQTEISWSVPGADDLATAQWIDAVRARVLRRMPFGPRPHGPLAADGHDAASALAYAYVDQDPLYETVRSFYRDHLGHDLIIDPIGDDFRLFVAPLSDPTVRVDLVDTGEGLGQVLPVAVALGRAAHAAGPSLLALEQPELHLHPKLHEQLAAWMCGLVNQNRGPRLVVETHSENMLLAVLLSLLDGNLNTDDLVVYWVHQMEDGQSLVERVTFDEFAFPQGVWPPDVFQEDAALAAKLNALRMERHQP